MSSCNEDLVQQVLNEFTGSLQSKLSLAHFSQFYDDLHLANLAQQEAKQVLAHFQAKSTLSIEETVGVVNELLPRLQEVIQEWKVRNEENKNECELFLQRQVDFLLSDFRTSVMIKLVSAPDVALETLDAFLERRKIVLIDIFDKLAKPGDPQSTVNLNTRFPDRLECVKMENLEKQRLHLEQEATNKNKMVLGNAEENIIEYARRLKSNLQDYQGKYPKDLVKGKLEEINSYLCTKGKELKEYHPNIHSAVLRTTAEVRKCLDENDYEDMSAQEFAETLHEQLLYDFSGESQIGRNSSGMDLDSISSSDDESTSPISTNRQGALLVSKRNEICTNKNEAGQGKLNEFQTVLVEKEGIKEESDNDEVEVDEDTNGIVKKNVKFEAALIQFGDDGENSEETEENKLAESSMSTRNSHCNNFIARVQKSSKPIGAKCSRPKRRCRVVVETKKTLEDVDDNNEWSGNDEDLTRDENDQKEMDIPVSSSKPKPKARKPRQARKRSENFDDNGKLRTDKITYLCLDKTGRPMYRCNVCYRQFYKYMLKHHGEYCGKSDNPFACKECRATFICKTSLDTHARTHTGEKPFKCSKCPEKFSQKCSLTRHLSRHVRGTRHNCQVCKLSFISRHRLHDHNKSMHQGILPFGCLYCDERYTCMANLKSHVISHADLRPLRCPFCDLMASCKDDLVRHIHIVHSESRHDAQKLANEAAIDYLVNDTKDESYRHMPKRKINSLVVSHVINKANLKLPKRATRMTRTRRSIDLTNNP